MMLRLDGEHIVNLCFIHLYSLIDPLSISNKNAVKTVKLSNNNIVTNQDDDFFVAWFLFDMYKCHDCR